MLWNTACSGEMLRGTKTEMLVTMMIKVDTVKVVMTRMA